MLPIILPLVATIAQAPALAVADVHAKFVQEVPTTYTRADGLPSDDVRQLATLADGRVVAADAAGHIAAYEGGRWSALQSPGFATERLLADGPRLWAVGEGKFAVLRDGKWSAFAADAVRDVRAVAAWKDGLLVAAGTKLWHVTASGGSELPWGDGPIAALAVIDQRRIAVGTGAGLSLSSPAKPFDFQRVYPSDARYSWSPRRVTVLITEGKRLWFGAENGAGVLEGGAWTLYAGKDGLPWNGFTCAASDGATTWFGTDRGAMHVAHGRWALRASKRWLPSDAVASVAVDAGGVWVATANGVTRIEKKPMTLAEKAMWFEKIVDERHTRMGFVVRCTMRTPGDPATAWINHTDNDGLYTAMYGAGECFRYGATKDPDAKRHAVRSFQALKLLFDVTGIPGFPARAVVPTTWKPDPNEGFGAAANAAQKASDPLWKEILPRWPKSADGKYWWKCDTSSDEICGHFFFYAAYYDLVADTPAEKAEVVAVVRALADHIVDHGFQLVDHDGKPTRWGNWSPDYCNSIDGWADRGVQAVEMLSFVNVAHHVTGDRKYLDAAKLLRDKYAYHINAMYGRAVFPPENVVPWDNNLAFLSYYGLLKYETDPRLLQAYRTSIDRNWLFVSKQNDPFFNFVFTAVFPDKDKPLPDNIREDFGKALDRGVATLRGTPLMLTGWTMRNSWRLDVVQYPTPRQRPAYGWSAVTGEALPIDERSHIRINSDHLYLDNGYGDGTEYEGTFYLLPYYLGLYYGYLK
jgi:hypothetical protein